MPINRISKLWNSHTMEYHLAIKKEWLIHTCCKVGKSQKHWVEQKKPHTKEYTLYHSIYWNSRRGKANLWWKKSEQWLLLVGGLTGTAWERHKAAFWGVGSVLYLDRDVGYMDVSSCQNWWNYPVKILLCMSILNWALTMRTTLQC